MWMFLTAIGEVYEKAWDLPPAIEMVVAVPQSVEEEGRCAALLEWLTINVV